MAQATNMLTLENFTKFLVIAGVYYSIITGIDGIKSDILLIKQGNKYEVKALQYQLDECCGHKQNRARKEFTQPVAILPDNKLED